MSFQVSITPTGKHSTDALRGKARKSFDTAVKRLAAEGCKAGDYRLSGEGIEHICSVQLYGRYRLLVCFPDTRSVVILLVGEHQRKNPQIDVYLSLYRLLGLPEPEAKRTKPPCCDTDGQPPFDPDLLDRFREGADQLRRRLSAPRQSTKTGRAALR